MLSSEQINSEALRLHYAEKNRQQVKATTLTYPNMTLEDAYAVQSEWIKIKQEAGHKIIGHKVGLTSRVMQETMGINEPDYGTLLDHMVFEEGSTIEVAQFLDLKVEVELAFILHTKLTGPGINLTDVLRATEYVVPALEFIAARSYRIDPDTGYKRTVRDTVADNAANAGIMLGASPIKPDARDMRWIGALMSRNGVIEETGVSAAVLNHPANGIAWLANKYAAHGVSLEPGQIILSGSFTRPLNIRPGDTFHIDYRSLGSISFHAK